MIFGHKKQWEFLLKMVQKKRIPHALLFFGPEGLGKKVVALEFAKFLFGQDPFSHPDFIFVKPINNLISIQQIRDLIWRLSLKPFAFEFKIAIIDNAHLMASDAQNCFLKKLEEPQNSIIILITHYPNLLLPTILSRCQKIKFHPLPKEEIKNFLIGKGLEKGKTEKILELSKGKVGKVIELLDPKKYLEIEEKMKDFKKIIQSPLYLRFNYVKDLVEKEEPKETLKIWLYFLREKLIEALRKPNEEVQKLIKSISILEKIYYLILTKNINKRLALEMMMLEL